MLVGFSMLQTWHIESSPDLPRLSQCNPDLDVLPQLQRNVGIYGQFALCATSALYMERSESSSLPRATLRAM